MVQTKCLRAIRGRYHYLINKELAMKQGVASLGITQLAIRAPLSIHLLDGKC